MSKYTTEIRLKVMADFFATPWTIAHQAPQSMEFSRQEYWSRLPFPFPGDLPDLRTEPMSPAWTGEFFTTEPPGKLRARIMYIISMEK